MQLFFISMWLQTIEMHNNIALNIEVFTLFPKIDHCMKR